MRIRPQMIEIRAAIDGKASTKVPTTVIRDKASTAVLAVSCCVI